MILPSKHLAQDRALLTISGKILGEIAEAKTISTVWESFSRPKLADTPKPAIRYQRFVLALDLLFMMKLIDLRDGKLHRTDK
tara:strand:- start:7997 stop:8242 length:246 start_codon:yes stop_codon:yes gene_type:complete